MRVSEYELMQMAVDIVGTSPHPTNKVAAALYVQGLEPVARTNVWPRAIEERFGHDVRIGNSSGTIHAETACLLAAPKTDGANLFVTDVPCPNCVKNMAESGITAMYIDHKGFTKDFAVRRGDHFDNMALRICEMAGINVYRIFRKEKRIEEILKIPANFKLVIERPAVIDDVSGAINPDFFEGLIEGRKGYYRERNFALAVAKDKTNKAFVISAESHPCPGFTKDTMESGDEKYSTILQPTNRVIMMAARHGLKIDTDYLYASRVPTSRELVDMIGAGLNKIRIGDQAHARDKDALAAFKQLTEAGILNIE